MSVQALHAPHSVQPAATPGAGPAAHLDLAADFAALARVILGATPAAPVQAAAVEPPAPVSAIPVQQVVPAAPAARGSILRELAFLDD